MLPVAQTADRIPERIARVTYVDTGVLPDGMAQFDTYPPEEQDRLRQQIGDSWLLPQPPWERSDDPDNLAGIDDATLDLLRARSTPEPLRVATDPLRLSGPPRVPTALIACTLTKDEAEELIAEGHPYFTYLRGSEVYGLPTGHWPMLSEPARLAEMLLAIADLPASQR